MKKVISILSLTILALLWTGCAGSRQAVQWDDSMQGLFSGNPDNPTSHPRHLWSKADEERLLRQMGYADVAAVGTVRVVTQCDRYGKRQVTLEFQVTEILHGDLDDELEDEQKLSLKMDTDSRHLQSTVKAAREIPGTQFLVFLKRKPQGSKSRLSYDFYRPNTRLLAEVKSIYSRL